MPILHEPSNFFLEQYAVGSLCQGKKKLCEKTLNHYLNLFLMLTVTNDTIWTVRPFGQ